MNSARRRCFKLVELYLSRIQLKLISSHLKNIRPTRSDIKCRFREALRA